MIGWRARVHQQRDSALLVTYHTNGRNSGTRRSPAVEPHSPSATVGQPQARLHALKINLSRTPQTTTTGSRLSRSGARYLDCSCPVSPDRSPNPACPSPGTGLSTVPAASGVVEDPGAGDLAATVTVPGDRYGFEVE